MLLPLAALAIALVTQEAPDPEWRYGVLTYEMEPVSMNRAWSREMPLAHVGNPGGPSVLFTCYEGRYRAIVNFSAADFREAVEASWARSRWARLSLRIDGEGAWSDSVAYLPAAGLAQVTERKPSAQMFNAIVRGQKIEARINRREWAELVTPVLNDSFTRFASECKRLEEERTHEE